MPIYTETLSHVASFIPSLHKALFALPLATRHKWYGDDAETPFTTVDYYPGSGTVKRTPHYRKTVAQLNEASAELVATLYDLWGEMHVTLALNWLERRRIAKRLERAKISSGKIPGPAGSDYIVTPAPVKGSRPVTKDEVMAICRSNPRISGRKVFLPISIAATKSLKKLSYRLRAGGLSMTEFLTKAKRWSRWGARKGSDIESASFSAPKNPLALILMCVDFQS